MNELRQKNNKLMALLASSQSPISFSAIKKNIALSKEELQLCIKTCNLDEVHPFIIQQLPDELYAIKAKADFDEFIKESNERQNTESLSRAAEEVLSLLLYKGVSTKEEIDWLRGVNSLVSIRNLIEKSLVNEEIKCEISYYAVDESVFDSLGLAKKEDLHNFEVISSNIINVLALK